MRHITDSIHAVLLRLLGACGIAYFFAILASIPVGLAFGRHMSASLAVGFIGGGICLVFLLPRMTPDWLRHPSHAGHGVTIVLAMVAVQIFVLTPMAGIAVAGFEPAEALLEPYMAAAVLPSAGIALMAAITGILLGNWPDPHAGFGSVGEAEQRPSIVGLRGSRLPDLSRS